MTVTKNQADLEKLKAFLKRRKAQVDSEIVAYPPPIPACDQQFNYLLEQRGQLSQELQRLTRLAQTLPEHKAIRDFIADSTYISAAEAEELLAA